MASVDELIRQLQSGSSKERHQAAELLGQLGDSQAVPALLKTLDDDEEDTEVRIAAAHSIGQIGDLNTIQGLLSTYEICPVKLHKSIFEAIGKILGRTSANDDESREIYSRAVDTLIQAVQNHKATEEARAAAADALGKTRDSNAIPALTEQLHEYKPIEVAKAAARALRNFDDPQVIHALAKTATNQKIMGYVRGVAVESLGDIGNPQAVDTLISILEDQSVDDSVRAEAARALGRIGDPKAIEPLIRILKSDSERSFLRKPIADALGAFRDPRATDALVEALGCNYYIARAAADSLKKLRDRRAVEPLVRLLNEESHHFTHQRDFAVQILGVLGDPRGIPALAKALRDKNKDIRNSARKSLQQFVLTHPDAILRMSPDERNLLERLIQDAQHEELSQEICK